MKMKIGENGGEDFEISKLCNCERGDSAMVFIHRQDIEAIYSFCDAYRNGTLFTELDKPFMAGGGSYGQ